MSYEIVDGEKIRIYGSAGKKNYSYGYATAYITHAPDGRYYIELATRRKLATTQPKGYKTKNAAIRAAKKMVVKRG